MSWSTIVMLALGAIALIGSLSMWAVHKIKHLDIEGIEKW